MAIFRFIMFVVILLQPRARGKLIDGSSTANVTARFNEITKSERDSRSYRGLKLANDLNVLLISDPDTDKSAACWSIGVGSLFDLPDIPGLVNLFGHLLLKGRKRSAVYEFNKFVTGRDGHLQLPVTQPDTQRISFDIDPAFFRVALEKFADFFCDPELSGVLNVNLESVIDLIQEDFERHARLDEFRIEHVETSISKKNHPYSRYFVGNRETLYQHTRYSPEASQELKMASIYEKVKTFFSLWYSSNIMTLAVLGRENLDELEELVVPLFAGIVNKKMKKLHFSYERHPWGSEELKRTIYIIPSNDIHRLRLNFPVPYVLDKYRSAPDTYIGMLLANEVPGSLVSWLRREKLCDSLKVHYNSMIGIAFYNIQCNLTENGLDHIDDAISIIFQYLRLIMEIGVNEEIFKELKSLLEVDFLNFRRTYHRLEPRPYVEQLATSMHAIPVNDVVSYDFIMDQWDPLLIEKFLSHLKPDNMNVSIVSKAFSMKANKEEKYCKTAYGFEDIPKELLERWFSEKLIPKLQLPPPNEFVQRNSELSPINENEPKDPYIILESSTSEIWFKQDDKLRVPTLYVTFELYSSVFRLGPSEWILWRVFRFLLQFSVKEYMYSALLAGFSYDIGLETSEIRITLSGPSDTFPGLFEKFLSKIAPRNVHYDIQGFYEENFIAALGSYLKTFHTSIKTDHFFQLDWYRKYLGSENGWSAENIMIVGSKLQYSDMEKFLSRVFRRIFIRGFIHGNCTKENATVLAYMIEETFRSSNGLLLQEILRPRVLELTEGRQFVYQAFNDQPNLYAYSLYFQFNTGLEIMLDTIASLMFHYVIGESCSNLLSYREYKKPPMIECVRTTRQGVRGYIIRAVTEKDTQFVDAIVDKFLRTIPDTLNSLTNKQLEELKELIRNNEFRRPTGLKALSNLIWFEISSRLYNFNRNAMAHEQLNSMRRSHLQSFYRKVIDTSSLKPRNKLTIHVFPRGKKRKKSRTANIIPSGVTKIVDAEDFKMSSTLHPYNFLQEPFVV